MYMGGQHNTPQAARIIRYSGLLIPVVLVGYGYLQTIGVIQGSSPASLDILLMLSIPWLTTAIWQFIWPAKHKLSAIIGLSAYHILGALYVLLIIGIFTPLLTFWVVLLSATYLYLGQLGILLNVGTFMVMVLVHIISLEGRELAAIPYDLAIVLAVLLTGLIITGLSRAQAIDRKELRRSHAQEVLQRDRLLTIVNNLADAILSTDKDGVIRVYNAASLNLLDTNDSLNGQHIDVALPLVDLNGEPINLSALLKKVAPVMVRDDLYYVFEDGQRLRLEVTISPIRKSFRQNSSGDDGYIMIIRDVTKPKSLEEERDEFISVVSHELRTPVTVVEGSLSNLDLMLDKPEISEEQIAETVSLAREQTAYLAKMINDLSALSRAERGVSDEPEEINVRELAQSLFRTYSPEAEAKGLTLDLDILAKAKFVNVSRLYLEELLQNLITNAIKYTKQGSVIISVQPKDQEIIFSVKDSGIGISKTDQAKVFKKFYRSEDYRTRETGGTGLGLYVSSKLARKLGTEISLVSRINFGSTFSFSLPVHQPKDD